MDELKPIEEIEALNGTLKVGDRVAVAVGSGTRDGGMRVGEVLAILPGKRIKVMVDLASGFFGYRVSKDTGQREFTPRTMTYDDPSSWVKLGAMQDAL